jgi:hypothetical protein
MHMAHRQEIIWQQLCMVEDDLLPLTLLERLCVGHTVEHRSNSNHVRQGTTRTNIHVDELISDYSSNHIYSEYDQRPVKPLDQHLFERKLNEYSVGNASTG